MPDPSWEASNNTWSYGYLKFLDFQSAGYDVHVTMQKDKNAHISIYYLGGKKLSPPGNLWMNVGIYGLGLDQSKGTTLKNTVSPAKPFPTVPGYSSYSAFFMDKCNVKALALNMIAPKPPVPKAAPSFTPSDFPALGS